MKIFIRPGFSVKKNKVRPTRSFEAMRKRREDTKPRTSFLGLFSGGERMIHSKRSTHKFTSICSFYHCFYVFIFDGDEAKPPRIAKLVYWNKNVFHLAILAKIFTKIFLRALERNVTNIQFLSTLNCDADRGKEI